MKIGCCGGLEEREMLEKNGFDYIECPVAVPMGKTEAELETIAENAENLPFYAFNCFIPGELKITGREVDFEALTDYVEEACTKVGMLGGKVIVFGSGGARKVPEGFSRTQAWQQLKDFLEMTAAAADKNDITIAIEPLNKGETNILNSVEESLKIAQEVDIKDTIKVLVDLYHLEKEDEPYSHIVDAGDWLTHVHVADSGRYYPGSGEYDYDTFLKNLKEIDYNRGISIECKWNNKEEESKKALKFLHDKIAEIYQ